MAPSCPNCHRFNFTQTKNGYFRCTDCGYVFEAPDDDEPDDD